ncbi:flavodoxin [Enterococcus gilvus]|uniref:flavodoxin n=1 Tax=Enterococcus gilvus TaxID=160453 RepID=UPI002906D3A2|nr:flavodoxin [Enterococcus gilvus]MDU5510066.1 flavodoxin [Enterococcus gilvus]
MTSIIIFFSRAGENYIDGKKKMISVGNTERLARMISEQTQLATYSIRPIVPYPINYEEAVEQARLEKFHAQRVDYQKDPIDLEKIKTIFLGFPNWWGTYPRIIQTFLADHEWKDKVIYPFCTHEGSAFGSSLEELSLVCSGAEIKTGLAIRGSKSERADTAIKNWLLSYSKQQS